MFCETHGCHQLWGLPIRAPEDHGPEWAIKPGDRGSVAHSRATFSEEPAPPTHQPTHQPTHVQPSLSASVTHSDPRSFPLTWGEWGATCCCPAPLNPASCQPPCPWEQRGLSEPGAPGCPGRPHARLLVLLSHPPPVGSPSLSAAVLWGHVAPGPGLTSPSPVPS